MRRWAGVWVAVAVAVSAVGGWAATGGGTITTIAGDPKGDCSEAFSFGGDGGPATRGVSVSFLGRVAVDGQGNVYVADSRNNRGLRRVSPSGTITTVAGNGNLDRGTGLNGPTGYGDADSIP